MGKDPENISELQYVAEMFARGAQSLAVTATDEEKEILLKYARYLLGEKPRSYPALADYLEWYGKKFLLPELRYMLQGHIYKNMVELGCGTGWLIKELGLYVPKGGSVLAIDKRDASYKRPAGVKFIDMDLENEGNVNFLSSGFEKLEPRRTLVIANQFLHCVDNRNQLVEKNRAVWLVVEVTSLTWRKQIAAFGGTSLSTHDIMTMFHDARYHLFQQRRTTTLNISIWHPDD